MTINATELLLYESAERVRPEHRRKFGRACRALADVITAVREYEPAANLYLQEDTMYLMIGPSHDDNHEMHGLASARIDNSACSMRIPHSDGGAW